jgi:sulfatase modifying factor 1
MKEKTIFISVAVILLTWASVWAAIPGDFEGDGDVDLGDYSVLAGVWLLEAGEPNWNPACDMAYPADGVVDGRDLLAFLDYWLLFEPPDVPADMMFVGGGEFLMGDSLDEGWSDERPVRAVYVDSFHMGRYEVTNRQYCDYLNSAMASGQIKVVDGFVYGVANSHLYCDTSSSSSYSQIDYAGGVFSARTKGGRDMSNDPMVRVSWHGAAVYCNYRSQQEGYEECYDISTWACDFSKQGYRLATEAEWEYAGRGGLSDARFPWGETISHTQANYYSDSRFSYDISATRSYHPSYNDGVSPYTAPVGSFEANGYGLYDMVGNVCEWCNDWYGSDYYVGRPQLDVNPTGPEGGDFRVLRGGGWRSMAYSCRVSQRLDYGPDYRDVVCGFRVVLDLN